MGLFPKKLEEKLKKRRANEALRKLNFTKGLVDFSSNDYLGFAREKLVFEEASKMVLDEQYLKNGSTGSRLLSGNYPLYEKTEAFLASFYQTETALIFNSGYDANLGFFSAIPQRGDIIFYDEFAHASIRDGIKMSNAKSYKFSHNDLEDLKKRCNAHANNLVSNAEIYVVTESVFSMDGDSPNLKAFAHYCKERAYHFIVDEAHATGIFGKNGEGLIPALGIQDMVFARLATFGKAMGCHGAVILGSNTLKMYLMNYARSYIYTTSLPPHSIATVLQAYYFLTKPEGVLKRQLLQKNIELFKEEIKITGLQAYFISSNSAIHSCLIPENEKVKEMSEKMEKVGFDVKPILAPTVAEGSERLRFCIHSYNKIVEIKEVLKVLKKNLE